jgi:MYXO-CTERM domain-containing protein
VSALLAGVVAALLAQSSAPYVRTEANAADPLSACLYWSTPTLVFRQASGGGVTAAQQAAVSTSWRSWDAVLSRCGSMRIEEGPATTQRKIGYAQDGSDQNVVLFRDRSCKSLGVQCAEEGDCANEHDCWEWSDGTIALTTTSYSRTSGRIFDSDIEMNAASFRFTTVNSPSCVQTTGGACTCPTSAPCVLTDVQNTMTHEVGHALGLDHTELSSSVMFRSAGQGEISKRTLDPGSQDFVCSVYPQGMPPQACVVRPLNRTLGAERKGCSTSGAGTPTALLALGALALLARRRRA